MHKETGTTQENNLLELDQVLDDFKPIANPFFKSLLEVLPVIIITFLLLDALVLRFVSPDIMTQTGLTAAAIANTLLLAQFRGIGEVLRTLWKRGAILSVRFREDKSTNRFPDQLKKLVRGRSGGALEQREANQSLEDHYRDYVSGFKNLLNHKASLGLGFMFAAIIFISYPYRWQARQYIDLYPGEIIDIFLRISWISWLDILSETILAYIIGLIAWRMILIAIQVTRLNTVFELDIKVQHPDKSGGLRPLGDLCFINALVITVPSIYLAGWILLIPQVERFSRYTIWIDFFSQLLILTFVLAFLAFFQPLYAIHHAMVRRRVTIQGQLDELSKQIDEMAKKLLEEVDTADVEKSEELKKKIAILKQVYESNSDIPVWPFDKSLILKFVSSQTIPLLSLTNIGPAILNLVGRLFRITE